MLLDDPLLDFQLLLGIAFGCLVCASVFRGYFTRLDETTVLSLASNSKPGCNRSS